MDRRFKLSLLGAVVTAAQFSGAAVTTASAADLLPPPPIVHAPEVVVKPNTGWYLRGDISYDFQKVRDVTAQTGGANHVPFHTQEVDDSFNVGLGIGYQVTNNLRVDLTGEYIFGADFHGTTKAPFCNDGNPGLCTSTEKSDVDKFKLLANAYYDIGHFGSFTPYVGAGIGGAYVSYGDVSSVNRCVRDQAIHPAPCPGQTFYPANGISDVTYTPTTLEGGSDLRFAWALHAGTAYSLSQNVKLDLGYTFSRIEGGELGRDKVNNVTIHDDGFNDHTIRAGLRYQFGGAHH